MLERRRENSLAAQATVVRQVASHPEDQPPAPARSEAVRQPAQAIEGQSSAVVLPGQAKNVTLYFIRHSLAIWLPLLAALMLLQLVNNLDYLAAAILVGPQLVAGALLLLAVCCFLAGHMEPVTGSCLDGGFSWVGQLRPAYTCF